LWKELLSEADRCFPNETGGVLLGHEAADTKDLVITHAVGPGPNAIHELTAFVPDSVWQQAQIDDYYHKVGRIETYLGDWHTHPSGGSSFSSKDRKTLKRIANTPEARMPSPIMAILYGERSDWDLQIGRLSAVKISNLVIGYRIREIGARIWE
jgi:integrative and conjugative element protein (TIGR02256 family)